MTCWGVFILLQAVNNIFMHIALTTFIRSGKWNASVEKFCLSLPLAIHLFEEVSLLLKFELSSLILSFLVIYEQTLERKTLKWKTHIFFNEMKNKSLSFYLFEIFFLIDHKISWWAENSLLLKRNFLPSSLNFLLVQKGRIFN